MKCPYCEKEMQSGYLRNASQPVQWIPDGTKPAGWRGGLARGSVQLGNTSFWDESRASACYCPSCKVVIIPVE